jgi:hypothetical protein
VNTFGGRLSRGAAGLGFDFGAAAGTLTAGGFDFGAAAGTLTAGGFDFAAAAGTLTAGGGRAVATIGGAGFGTSGVTVADGFEGGASMGGVTGEGRTGVSRATDGAGDDVFGARNCGDRNHAASATSTMTSIATCTIARARLGWSDL